MFSLDLLKGAMAARAQQPNSNANTTSATATAATNLCNSTFGRASEQPRIVSGRARLGLDLLNAVSLSSHAPSPARGGPKEEKTTRSIPLRSLSGMGLGGASAPNLLNVRRAKTVPLTDKSSSPKNAQWGAAAAPGTSTPEGSMRGGLTRWGNGGSSGDLSKMDQSVWSTKKMLPKRRKDRRKKRHEHGEKTKEEEPLSPLTVIRVTSTDAAKSPPPRVVSGDSRPLRVKRTTTNESRDKAKSPPARVLSSDKHPLVTRTPKKEDALVVESSTQKAATEEEQPVVRIPDSTPLLVQRTVSNESSPKSEVERKEENDPAYGDDVVEVVTGILNDTAKVEAQKAANEESAKNAAVAQVAVSLASLEMNRCARMALRRERSGGSLKEEAEEGVELEVHVEAEVPSCEFPNLGCSETILEHNCEESVDDMSAMLFDDGDAFSFSLDSRFSL